MCIPDEGFFILFHQGARQLFVFHAPVYGQGTFKEIPLNFKSHTTFLTITFTHIYTTPADFTMMKHVHIHIFYT